MVDLSLWYLLPLGIAIATIYGATGISGANFWVPVYMLLVGFEPRVAFWVGLVSMLFGSASGLAAHLTQRTERWAEVGGVCWISVPLAIAGARLAPSLPVRWLVVAFGLFAAVYGVVLLAAAGRGGGREERADRSGAADRGLRAGLGGLLIGAISVGLGALVLPAMLRRWRDVPAAAAGSTLTAVFATSVAAALARLDRGLVDVLSAERGAVAAALVFAIPGVLVGGQVGPRLARRLDRAALQRAAGGVLVLAGGFLGARGAG